MRGRQPVPVFVRWSAILLMAAVWAAACESTTEPPGTEPPGTEPPRAVRIEAATATDVTRTVGTEVTPAPAVRATDEDGKPVAGVAISFVLGGLGGTIGNASVKTDSLGVATVGSWTLGRTAGTQTLTALAPGLIAVVFTATAKAGPAAQVTPVSGNQQIASAGETLGQPLRVQVSDAFGNPVGGAPVTFTVMTGEGSLEGSAAVTSSDGSAESGPWTLGPVGAIQHVRAASGDAQATFVAYVRASAIGEGQLAFVSIRDGNSEIYAINADGTGLTRLTNDAGQDRQPAWSPDGQRIAFVSDRSGNDELYVMNADGSNVVRRTFSTRNSWDPSWSPEGTTIAYSTHSGNGSANLWVMSADANAPEPTLLFEWPGYDAQPTWAPDGTRLAFVSDYAGYDFVLDIYTLNADGSGQTLLTGGSFFWPDVRYYQHPAWSPDGSMIAFVYGSTISVTQSFPDIRFKVAVMTADGSFIKDVAWAGDINWRGILDPGSLTWSPDGRGIAYTFVDCDLLTRVSCSNVRSVNYASLDGTQQGTIVPNAHSPSWRP